MAGLDCKLCEGSGVMTTANGRRPCEDCQGQGKLCEHCGAPLWDGDEVCGCDAESDGSASGREIGTDVSLDPPPQVDVLARQFAAEVFADLGDYWRGWVNGRNYDTTYDRETCASRLQCDSDQCMRDAFELLTGRPPELNGIADQEAIDTAWQMAAHFGFDRRSMTDDAIQEFYRC